MESSKTNNKLINGNSARDSLKKKYIFMEKIFMKIQFLQNNAKIFISILLSLSIIGCASSKNLIKPSLDSIVVEMPGNKSNYLYESIQIYVTKKWTNPQSVTRFADKASQKLIISGHLTPEDNTEKNAFGGYSYITQGVLTFYVKDDKFKITLDNVSTITRTYNGYGQVVTTQESPGVMTQHMNLLDIIANEIKENITKQKDQEIF